VVCQGSFEGLIKVILDLGCRVALFLAMLRHPSIQT
jgi:hypothetical protein